MDKDSLEETTTDIECNTKEDGVVIEPIIEGLCRERGYKGTLNLHKRDKTRVKENVYGIRTLIPKTIK